MHARLARLFERIWYGRSPLAAVLVPVAWVYEWLLRMHRQRALGNRATFAVPVVVVGNVTVGGTGKTPVVIWLVEQLRKRGFKPGIVTRGYRGSAVDTPLRVDAGTSAAEAGDEAVLLARRLRCPVVACADRVSATRTLIASDEVDVVVSDDGLQHFALRADCEVIVVDGSRGLGNGRLLPAGPLREHPQRLAGADVVLVNGSGWTCPGALQFDVRCSNVVQLCDGMRCSLAQFAGRSVHALAAIGNPDRFFALLRTAGCTVAEYVWPDHASIPADALTFTDGAPVLVTQKDAVKLTHPVPAGVWSVDIDVEFSSADATSVIDRIVERMERDTGSQ